jgi:hypothetical protein
MHPLSRMGLALLGLTLVAPSSSRAGLPFRDEPYGGPAQSSQEDGYASRPRHLCAKCQAKLQQGDPSVAMVPPPIPAMPEAGMDGNCTACQMAGGSGTALATDGSGLTVVSPPAFGPTMTSGYSSAGHATVGGPMMTTTYLPPGGQVVYESMPGQMTMNPSAAGHAFVGGMPSTVEPAPIGVVQTGYRPTAGMPTPGAMGPAGSSPFNPAVGPSGPAFSGPGSFPGHRRPSVLAHLFGISGRNRWAEAQEAERRSRHAAISYGPNGQTPAEIPASMVYGR